MKDKIVRIQQVFMYMPFLWRVLHPCVPSLAFSLIILANVLKQRAHYNLTSRLMQLLMFEKPSIQVMKGLPERTVASKFPAGSLADSTSREQFVNSDKKASHSKSSKALLLSSFFPSSFSIFGSHSESSSSQGKESSTCKYGWTTAVKRVLLSGSMWRLQEHIMGRRRTDVSSSNSEIWLLGICYKVSLSPEQSSGDALLGDGLVKFSEDFSSRIWITYRKGFDAIGDSRFTSDAHWGCMLRSSQMLVAQALLFHRLGRTWRKASQKPFDRNYIEILHHFGDSEHSAFSIHNLLLAGKAYGLAAGSWVGPYAVCRSWENLVRASREKTNTEENNQPFPMTMYIVSGDEDGEQGGAPVVCIENIAMLCSNVHDAQGAWAPILLLVPLVLGLDKVNPRYIPLLLATFTFPQSLGILGGKPGASTYIVGVQGDKAIYLDPHEVQPVIEIVRDNVEADTSSYHCNGVQHMPFDMIDPSLAIGFYCRDKADFDDFCSRASELASQSNGAPLFTVAQSRCPSRPVHSDALGAGLDADHDPFDVERTHVSGAEQQEDEWQIL